MYSKSFEKVHFLLLLIGKITYMSNKKGSLKEIMVYPHYEKLHNLYRGRNYIY